MANVALLAICVALSDPVTWNDLLATWQQNHSAVRSLRVEVRCNESETRDFGRYLLSLADSKEEFARSQRNLTDRDKEGLRRAAADFRAQAGNPILQRVTHFDYWTDRENYQVRGAPHGPVNDGIDRVTFPDVEASRDNLPSHFPRISVLSFGPATKSLFRRWDGANVGGMSGAAITTRYAASKILFPPLGRIETAWTGELHAIDAFFEDGALESEILGSVVYFGRTCQVVGRKWPPPMNNPGIGVTILVAWIDLERGVFPLRIEKYLVPDGKYGWCVRVGLLPSEGESLPAPLLVVKDVELREVISEFWYPVRGIVQSLGPDRAPTANQSVRRFLPHKMVEWEAVRVQADRIMSIENFSLEFPDKTVFVNDPTGDIRVTSDLAGFSERLVNQAVKRSEGGGSLRNYYFDCLVSDDSL